MAPSHGRRRPRLDLNGAQHLLQELPSILSHPLSSTSQMWEFNSRDEYIHTVDLPWPAASRQEFALERRSTVDAMISASELRRRRRKTNKSVSMFVSSTYPTTNGGKLNGSSVGICNTLHIHFCMFGADL